jgi:hypothetical protein
LANPEIIAFYITVFRWSGNIRLTGRVQLLPYGKVLPKKVFLFFAPMTA